MLQHNYIPLSTETFDSLLEEYFFEDAFVIKVGVYLTYFDRWQDTVILQIPEKAKSLDDFSRLLRQLTEQNNAGIY